MRDEVPGYLSKGYKLREKKTHFDMITHNSLRTNYFLNYNSVSYCKLFRAHKHHSKISLSQYIKKFQHKSSLTWEVIRENEFCKHLLITNLGL